MTKFEPTWYFVSIVDKHAIYTALVDKQKYFLLRNVGQALGFGSNGGNLSREVALSCPWMKNGTHYLVAADRAIWIRYEGLLILLGQLLLRSPAYERMAKIDSFLAALTRNHLGRAH